MNIEIIPLSILFFHFNLTFQRSFSDLAFGIEIISAL